ncbi:hypothetical protein VTK56DRAFT_1615 [Thermocarpiscus australiensis]
MSRQGTEILVHITAPARGADDAKYRTLAAAYLDFEPTTRTSIGTGLDTPKDIEREIGRGADCIAAETSQAEDVPTPSPPGVIESPLLSFRSAINNLASPRLQETREGRIPEPQLSWRPPPSVVQDSMPENDLAFPQYCTPTRILAHYTSAFDSTQSDLSPATQRRALQLGSSAPENGLAAAQNRNVGPREGQDQSTDHSNRPGHVSPVPTPSREIRSGSRLPGRHEMEISPKLPPDGVSLRKQPGVSPLSSTRQKRKHNQSPGLHGQRQERHEEAGAVIPRSPIADNKRPPPAPTPSDIVEESRIASSYPTQQDEPTASSRAESEPPLSKRPRTSADPDPDPGLPLARSASDIGPRRRKGPNTRAHESRRHQIADTLEILSPPPCTAEKELRPEDMITEVLASLARELNLEKRFQPASQTRDLRPFERGYWLVDCSSWEPALKRSAWGFLTDYLGKGAAGWGTSCRRDRDFSWIRLYCWGCVVGHMYLVLYLMSRRRVLYTGASWIGGDGKAVVVMGARAAPGG